MATDDPRSSHVPEVSGIQGHSNSHDAGREQADEAPRESEERYRLLVELSPDAIAIHREGKLVFVNSAAVKLLGAASPQELIGKPILDVVHPDYRDRVGERVRQMREGQAVPLIEEKFLRLDGTAVDVEVIATPFTYQGQPAVQVVAHDITARKRAEAALRESEERYRTLAEAAHDMIFIVDPTGCVQYVNSFSAEQFGCLPEALIGKPLGELFPSTISERQKHSLRQVFETGTPKYVETQTTFPNRQFWLGTWLAPIKNQANQVIAVLGIARDITGQVQVEEALRESEERYRLLFRHSPVGILHYDTQLRITDCNDRLATILQSTHERLAGLDITTLKDQRIAPALREALEGRERLYEGPYRTTTSSAEVWILMHTAPLFDQRGRVTGGVAIIEDITEHTRVAEEREHLLAAEHEQRLLAETLREVTSVLGTSLDCAEVLQLILEQLARVVSYDSASVMLVSGEKLNLVSQRDFRSESQSAISLTIKDLAHVQEVLERRLPVIIPDTYADPRWQRWPGREYVRCWLGVPLVARGQVIGMLNLDKEQAYFYTERHAGLAVTFAHQAALAVENARLFEAAQQHVAELEAVRQASLSLTSSLELPQVLDAIVESTLKLLTEAYDVHIFLYQDGRLTFGTALWSDGQRNRPFAQPRPHGLTYTVARRGEPIVVTNSHEHPLFVGAFPDWGGAIAGLPLKIGQRVVGVMNVGYRYPRTFPEAELRMLRLLADQAAIAVENARLYQEARRRASELSSLIEISRDILGTLDLPTVLERIATHARDVLEADDSEVYLLEPDGQTLRAIVALGAYAEQVKASPSQLGNGIVGFVGQSGIAEVVNDISQDSRAVHIDDTPEESHALMCAPLISKGQVIGVMALTRYIEQGPFTQADLDFFTGLARQAALAIENARLYEEARRRAGKLSALIEIGRDVLGTLDLPVVLERIATHARDLLEADDSEAYLVEPDGQTLRAIVALGQYADEVQVAPRRLGEGIVGSIAQSGVAEVINSAANDPRGIQVPGTPVEDHALMCAPLISKGQVIGAMALTRYIEQGPFSQADLDFLTGLARQAALAIENARLYEEARRRAGKLSALIEIGRDVLGTLDLPVVLERIATHARDLLEADDSEVYLVEPDGQTLRAIVALGQYADEIKATSRRLGEGIVGSIAQKGVVEVVNHVANDPRAKHVPGTPVEDHALMVAPLISKGRVIGAMALTRYIEQGSFSQADVDFLTGLARQAAIAIENARLYATEQQRTAELGHALEQQKELDRLKNQFIQNVSHELRTPLAIIRGYAELLDAGELGTLGPEQQEPIKVISRRVRMLGNLVDNLTAIIKVETSEMEKEPVDLTEMARAMLADFRVVAEKAGLTLTVQVEPNLPWVSGDATQLRRVLDNLLGNALKFTPAGGALSVSLEQEGMVVVLQVSDTGIGIPEDKVERVFERFYQVDGSMTRRYSGVGLGLALVKEIVEAHGGEVSAASTLGKGSTFRVTLPIYVNPPSSSSP